MRYLFKSFQGRSSISATEAICLLLFESNQAFLQSMQVSQYQLNVFVMQ